MVAEKEIPLEVIELFILGTNLSIHLAFVIRFYPRALKDIN